MRADWYLIIGSIVVSLAAVPFLLWYLLTVLQSPQPGDPAFIALAGFLMVPGIMLGGTATWVSARG